MACCATAISRRRAAAQKNYSTPYSRVVSHRSTDGAITSLTSEIGRDPVLPGVYGRSYHVPMPCAFEFDE